MKKVLITATFFTSIISSVFASDGQCPDKDILRKELVKNYQSFFGKPGFMLRDPQKGVWQVTNLKEVGVHPEKHLTEIFSEADLNYNVTSSKRCIAQFSEQGPVFITVQLDKK